MGRPQLARLLCEVCIGRGKSRHGICVGNLQVLSFVCVNFLHVRQLLGNHFTARSSCHLGVNCLQTTLTIVYHCRSLDLNHIGRLLRAVRLSCRSDVPYWNSSVANTFLTPLLVLRFGGHCGARHVARRQN